MNDFKWYIFFYSLFNLATLILIFIAITKEIFDLGCDIAMSYFMHYTSERKLFF